MAVFFFAWLIALLALTYWPDMPHIKPDEEKGFRIDYLGHFGFYTLLLYTFLLWQRFRGRNITVNFITQAVLIGLVLGVSTELTQQFIPGRSLNPLDLMFNCLGIVAAGFTYYVINSWKQGG
jgi:VanZ family protein